MTDIYLFYSFVTFGVMCFYLFRFYLFKKGLLDDQIIFSNVKMDFMTKQVIKHCVLMVIASIVVGSVSVLLENWYHLSFIRFINAMLQGIPISLLTTFFARVPDFYMTDEHVTSFSVASFTLDELTHVEAEHKDEFVHCILSIGKTKIRARIYHDKYKEFVSLLREKTDLKVNIEWA